MSHTIKVHEKEGYISVFTEGQLLINELTSIGEQFVAKEQKTGIRRVLIDLRKARLRVGIIDAFTYTSKSKIPILPGEKNAILVNPKSPDLFKVKLYTMRSLLCGLHVRKFFDEKEALEWLLL